MPLLWRGDLAGGLLLSSNCKFLFPAEFDEVQRGEDLGEGTFWAGEAAGLWRRTEEEDKRLTALLEGVFTKEKWSLSPNETALSKNSYSDE